MKRVLIVLAILLLAGSLFAGGAQQAATGEITLKLTYWGSPIEKQAIEAAMATFEKANPGIKVDAQHVPTDYRTKITTMIAGGVGPDVLYLDEAANEWGAEGRLINIHEMIEKDPEITADDFMEYSYYYSGPGKITGIMPAIENFALFYNKDIFTKAGIPLPPAKAENAWDWDTFVKIAKQLTLDASGKHPDDPGFNSESIMQYGVQIPLWGDVCWMPYVWSNGGSYVKSDGKTFGLSSPESAEVLQKIADLINVHHVMPAPAAQNNLPEISTALLTQRVAMVTTGQWVLLDLAANEELNFDIGVLPKFKKYYTIVQGGVMGILKDTKHLDAAWKLYKWFYNPEKILPLFTSGLWTPAMTTWFTKEANITKWAVNNPAHPANFRTAVLETALNNGYPSPATNTKNYGKISSIVNAALDQVWLGEKTAVQAMKEIEPQVNSLIDGFYEPGRPY
jgi:multiple sugar transport system substrate-binding protein